MVTSLLTWVKYRSVYSIVRINKHRNTWKTWRFDFFSLTLIFLYFSKKYVFNQPINKNKFEFRIFKNDEFEFAFWIFENNDFEFTKAMNLNLNLKFIIFLNFSQP